MAKSQEIDVSGGNCWRRTFHRFHLATNTAVLTNHFQTRQPMTYVTIITGWKGLKDIIRMDIDMLRKNVYERASRKYYERLVPTSCHRESKTAVLFLGLLSLRINTTCWFFPLLFSFFNRTTTKLSFYVHEIWYTLVSLRLVGWSCCYQLVRNLRTVDSGPFDNESGQPTCFLIENKRIGWKRKEGEEKRLKRNELQLASRKKRPRTCILVVNEINTQKPLKLRLMHFVR